MSPLFSRYLAVLIAILFAMHVSARPAQLLYAREDTSSNNDSKPTGFWALGTAAFVVVLLVFSALLLFVVNWLWKKCFPSSSLQPSRRPVIAPASTPRGPELTFWGWSRRGGSGGAIDGPGQGQGQAVAGAGVVVPGDGQGGEELRDMTGTGNTDNGGALNEPTATAQRLENAERATVALHGTTMTTVPTTQPKPHTLLRPHTQPNTHNQPKVSDCGLNVDPGSVEAFRVARKGRDAKDPKQKAEEEDYEDGMF
ncbi:hypothetical protein EG329_011141 [Mollisiaceae sp. DMI_Dod_QoI]|nr:hypothetical protein EG329_011141 [Helotiales sp. DMI_Dod_QoI]